MEKIDIIKEKILKNKIKELSKGVQNFYNGECAAIEINDITNVDEVIDLLKEIINKKVETENNKLY